MSAEPQTPAADSDRGPEIARAPATAGAIGFASGLLSAGLGVGGGVLMVPGLAFLLRLRHARATGTAMVVMLPVALAVLVAYHQTLAAKEGAGLDFAALGCLALGELVGVLLARPLLPSARSWRRWLGAPLLALAAWLAAQPFVSGLPAPAGVPAPPVGLLLAAGMTAGAVSVLLGLGGGVLTVPALALWLGYGQHRAQAMGLAVSTLVGLPVALIHLASGNVAGRLTPPLFIGAALGAWLAAANLFTTPAEALRVLFGLLLAVIAVTTLARHSPPTAVPEGK